MPPLFTLFSVLGWRTVPCRRHLRSRANEHTQPRLRSPVRSLAMPRHALRAAADLRRRLYEVLEHGTIGDRTSLIVGRLIVVLIIVNLVAITLESVPTFQV